MNLQNFKIGKIDVFSIGNSKKSFRYKKLLSYEKCRVDDLWVKSLFDRTSTSHNWISSGSYRLKLASE